MELKTPLYDTHLKLGGKMVPFAGYLLPVNYQSGIIAEHMAVRNAAGLFDVSHMGELTIKGPDATKNIQKIFTNDFSNMQDGQVRYTLLCYEDGGTVDDLLVYRVYEEEYLLVVNASNKDKDFAYIKEYIFGDASLSDISENTGQIALRGPKSEMILRKLVNANFIPEKYYTFTRTQVSGPGHACADVIPSIISRTGYTGEDGFEIYCKAHSVAYLYEKLLELGKDFGLIPCGLGARDTLRLEASMPLYGHELSEKITPIEAGLSFALKMQKDDFLGKAALITKGEPKIKRAGLELVDRGIAREGATVFFEGREIGSVTSGTMAPYLSKSVAMAMIESEYLRIGMQVDIDVRGKLLKANIVKMPFYKRA